MAARLGDSLRSDYERRGTRMSGISSTLFCTARVVRHLVSEKQTAVSVVKPLLAHILTLNSSQKLELLVADEKK